MIDLEFNAVSKRYRISQEDASTAAVKTGGAAGGQALLRRLKRLRRRKQEFWALRDVSFGVE
ncbi:MAG TPA: hypothetical protein VGB07_28715, partial [Blastocatellia bacterium]